MVAGTEEPQYEYSPLESGSREIRLAILEPTEDPASEIKIRLINVSLGTLQGSMVTPQGILFLCSKDDPPPHYSALSYCWGNLKDTRTIRINDIKTAITSNLESALRHLRLPDREQQLWIDALCINQHDKAEKSQQILLMRDIYATAHQVIVWLGDAGPNSGLAIDFISKHVVFHQGAIDESQLLESLRENDAALAFKTLGGDLLKRPWWFRVWVWQEIACAKRATVRCGPFEVPWDQLVGAVVFADRNHVTTNQLTEAELQRGVFYAPFKEMQMYRRTRFLGNPIKLLDLLCSSLRCGATDPKDKVFALLGLATDSESPFLSPDYSKTLSQVYIDLVRFFVERDNRLDILCASTHEKPYSELPSWVPDWSDNSQISNILAIVTLDAEIYRRYYYNASLNSTADAELLGDGNLLSVSGFGDDTIESVGKLFSTMLEIKDILSWQYDIAFRGDLFAGRTPYVAGGTKSDAFNRTISVDRDFYGHRASAGWRGLDFDPSLIPADLLPYLPDDERQRIASIQQFDAVGHFAPRRRFFVTRKGFFGLGSPRIREGDVVTILKGCTVPVLLRADGKYQRFIGEAYVCGIMDGEMMEGLDDGRWAWKRLVLR
jgi:hypothetical protein